MDICKTLDEVYSLLARIAVSGSGVETMASAKAKLRALYQELQDGKDVDTGG